MKSYTNPTVEMVDLMVADILTLSTDAGSEGAVWDLSGNDIFT